jgi:hypothetical protein
MATQRLTRPELDQAIEKKIQQLRSTWRARAVVHGDVSRKTRAARALPRILSVKSVWPGNFSAIWIVWMSSPRNSQAWTISTIYRWLLARRGI